MEHTIYYIHIFYVCEIYNITTFSRRKLNFAFENHSLHTVILLPCFIQVEVRHIGENFILDQAGVSGRHARHVTSLTLVCLVSGDTSHARDLARSSLS